MKRYEKYKDSGVEWIGEIPEHWLRNRLKYNVIYQKGRNPSNLKAFASNSALIYLSMEYLRNNPKQVFYVEDYENYLIMEDDEIVLLWDGSNAGEFIKSKKGVLSSTMAQINLLNLNKIYAYYYFKTLEPVLKYFTIGMGVPHVNSEELKNSTAIIPPPEEQTTIANYLDRKTAEIDVLIAKKEQLLKLYEEEKTAIINQAVTKGINPDAPMKNSGIEWLDDIPAHWVVKKLNYLGNIKYGLGQPPKQKFNGLPLIRATNIFRGIIDDKDMIFVDPDDIPYDRDPVLEENDIIVVRSGAYTADSAIIPKKYAGAITGYDMVFRTYECCNPKFIAYCFLSGYVLKNQILLHSLRAAQPHLNREELSETIILFPENIEEQTAIITHIEIESTRIDARKERIYSVKANFAQRYFHWGKYRRGHWRSIEKRLYRKNANFFKRDQGNTLLAAPA